MTPPVCVVGTGRSGSGYIAAVLNELGIRCGHESWWTPIGTRTHGLNADSSWCAVPGLGAYDGIVFHQVRHPLSVIASLLKAPDWGPYVYVRDLLVPPGSDPLRYAIDIYVRWNEACEARAAARWRLEDLDVGTLQMIGETIGHPVESTDAAEVLGRVSCSTNWHGDGAPVGWDDLPRDDRLTDLAHRYGYR